MKLPERPFELNTLFNAELTALLNEDDAILNPIVKAVQNKVEKINASSSYLKHFIRDLHESDGLLYIDGKLVIPFIMKNALMKTLHGTHPGQFGMKITSAKTLFSENRTRFFLGPDLQSSLGVQTTQTRPSSTIELSYPPTDSANCRNYFMNKFKEKFS